MKLNKKRVFALLLALCLALTSVSAFAATVEVEREGVDIPAEGVALALSRGGMQNNAIRFIFENLSDEVKAQLNYSASTPGNYYTGLTVSATMTYVAGQNPEGSPATYTVVNAPVAASESKGETALLLAVNYEDWIAASPELSAFKAENPSYASEQIFNPNPNNTVYTYPVTFSVKKPDGWGVIYYDSGIFPAGTVFIAPNNFTKYPSVWGFNDQTDSATGVSITGMPVSTYNQSWSRGTMGPVQFFTSKYSGTYHPWVMEFAYQQSYTDRNPVIDFNGETCDFMFNATNVATTSGTWLWAPESSGKTITLAEGQTVAVQMNKNIGAWGRTGVIALVPDNSEYSAFVSAIEATRTNVGITQEQFFNLQAATTNSYTPSFGESVTVTLNGKEITVAAGSARTNNYNGYAEKSGVRVYSYEIRLKNNLFPTYATLLDALAADAQSYTGFIQGKAVCPTQVKEGAASGIIITLNGEVIDGDLDFTKIKNGDVITWAPISADNFAPIGGEARITECGNNGYSYDGIYQAGFKDYNYKFLVESPASFSWPFDYKTLNVFQGCYINGYVTYQTDSAETTGDDTKVTVFVQDLPIIYSAIRSSDGRLELAVEYPASADTTKEIDGKTYNTPDYIPPLSIAKSELFNKQTQHLYITNKQSAGKAVVTVTDNGNGTFKINSTKSMPVMLTTVTKDENGMIISTAVTSEILDLKTGLNVQVGDNQTVYVWKGTPIASGSSTMIPLCAPLTK